MLLEHSSCTVHKEVFVYIDDFNTIEKVRIREAESHTTTRKRVLNILAKKSEKQFANVEEMATDIQMRVNSKKTQLLCIHDNKFNEINSYIRTRTDNINSGSTLKILGFNFNNNPSATHHVLGVIQNFYNKLWTLRFLKRSGLARADLIKVYYTIILPSVEYCSIVYGPLIPGYVSDRLEAVQKKAMKIVYGNGVDYNGMLENGSLVSLKKRREDKSLRFAQKAAMSERFGKWFCNIKLQRIFQMQHHFPDCNIKLQHFPDVTSFSRCTIIFQMYHHFPDVSC